MSINKTELQDLYSKGHSMYEISKVLKCSVHKVSYWMKKYKIDRRSRSEANYVKYNPDGDPFNIKTDLNQQEMFLKGLGLGIFWGEGNKTNKYSLRVANTDSGIIKTFRKFLIDIYRVKENKISYSLVCFNDASPVLSREYWSKELGILPEKFGKITIIPKQGKGTYKKKSEFGVCTISFSNIKLQSIILKELVSLKA